MRTITLLATHIRPPTRHDVALPIGPPPNSVFERNNETIVWFVRT